MSSESRSTDVPARPAAAARADGARRRAAGRAARVLRHRSRRPPDPARSGAPRSTHRRRRRRRVLRAPAALPRARGVAARRAGTARAAQADAARVLPGPHRGAVRRPVLRDAVSASGTLTSASASARRGTSAPSPLYLRLAMRALVAETGEGERLLPAVEALIKVVFLDMSLAMNTYIYGGFVQREIASELERAAEVAEEALASARGGRAGEGRPEPHGRARPEEPRERHRHADAARAAQGPGPPRRRTAATSGRSTAPAAR